MSGRFKLATHKMTSRIDIVLWALGLILLVLLLAILVLRRFYSRFRFFFAYVGLQILVEAVRFAASGNYATYFKVYWATEALYSLLILLALHEVFRQVFLLFYLYWWFWLIFPGTVAIVAGATIFRAFHHVPVEAAPIVTLILSFGLGANYLQCLLFAFFFLLVVFLGLPWRNQAFGIVQGFGIAALGAVFSLGLRSEFGNKFNTIAKYGPPVTYIIALVSWLFAFAAGKDPELTQQWAAAIKPHQLISQTRKYTEVLKEFLRRNDSS